MLSVRLSEHSSKPDSAVLKHLNSCPYFNDIVSLCRLPDILTNNSCSIDKNKHIEHAIFNHTQILQQNNNWLQLCFLESLFIKRHSPSLNVGVKATKNLVLFK